MFHLFFGPLPYLRGTLAAIHGRYRASQRSTIGHDLHDQQRGA